MFNVLPVQSYINLHHLTSFSEEWEKRQEHIREAIKYVIPCDVNQENPLAPRVFEPFDVITSCLCLEAGACADETTYRKAVKHVSRLLKPGGFLFIFGVHGQSFYTVGEESFSTFSTSVEIVESALSDAGLANFRWCNDDVDEVLFEQTCKKLNIRADYTGIFAISAKKQ